MREIRSSGSVEGVMGNHDSYSDFFPTLSLYIANCKSLEHFLVSRSW